MWQFKNILLIYNDAAGCDDAVDEAISLCRANYARLTLFRVVEGHGHSDRLVHEWQKRLRRLAHGISLNGVPSVDVVVRGGNTCQEVVRQVLRGDHDLMIVSSEDRGPLQSMYLTGTGRQFVGKCPCPVWIVRPQSAAARSRVMAAIPPTIDGDEDPLHRKILDTAASLAMARQTSLHVLHAWDVKGRDADRFTSEVHRGKRDDILDGYETDERERLDQMIGKYRFNQLRCRTHLVRGPAVATLVAAAREHDVGLIVMGTGGRIGLRALSPWNTAEMVLGSTDCSVLTVKPDGFRTPVVQPDENLLAHC